ncbi:SDR family oxidoreductase [Pelagibacterium halotolerans]|uniref:5-keto-D-gluconate 5-reductase n=1 Tax=Pelagibacterium halotolerans (strain DSM 22347 / JCM 15775 / CGMCC 1.7692 / B2) TaxID=1082931 RepID=G4RAR6_PELHB|nr:SDR family oxidoreductase [Pelagibacterium halotolerans]AEQ52589.1 5-keto-D-gluconate 5-reductase [Pelagibacterium halotolerans B2]QJR17697.1 SDR family oxidoreductase [Pelagibacterium halotolerans]SEA40874.1 glucose 1-dehydrogenase [Pelagibacterium halotolerans]
MTNLFDLTGKTALVTGSSQGIGYALAEGLAQHGARIVLNGRNPQKLQAAAKALRADGHDAHIAPFDVTDPDAVMAAITKIESEIAPIDILINNAGMQHRAPLEDFPHDKWDELMKTNLDSVFYVAQAAARFMLGRGHGKIVNIASATSELARSSVAPYTAAKGAVRNLTRGMATDWAAKGLQVNAIAPGYFRTPLNKALIEDKKFTAWLEARTPAGRWGDLDELKGAAIFLASDAASFVNGHTLYVDGGLTISL